MRTHLGLWNIIRTLWVTEKLAWTRWRNRRNLSQQLVDQLEPVAVPVRGTVGNAFLEPQLLKKCPVRAITVHSENEDETTLRVDMGKCIQCGRCEEWLPQDLLITHNLVSAQKQELHCFLQPDLEKEENHE